MFFYPHPPAGYLYPSTSTSLCRKSVQRISRYFHLFLPKRNTSSVPWIFIPALSVRRSAVGENHFSLSAGYSGYRRTCPLSTAEVGFIYGTIGVIALTIGGIVGGIAMARRGLKSCLWTMTIAMNLPNIVYLYLSFARPESIGIISGCVAIEQFGYGFGFTSLTYFMMLFSNGKHQTAHYAICTGFMALGLMLPGMISGWIEESIGYRAFSSGSCCVRYPVSGLPIWSEKT